MSKYIDTGFGFPVHISNAVFKEVFGQEILDINYKTLALMVLNQLVTKQGRLTGHELKYIVDKMEMTIRDFAKPLGVSHAVVVKWQKKYDNLTDMQWAIEKDIRLSVFERFLTEKAQYTLSELRNYLYFPPEKKAQVVQVNWGFQELVLPKQLAVA